MSGVWFFLAVLVVAKSPIGRAIADRISGRSHGGSDMTRADLESVEYRMEERLVDLEERLEDAERRLQQYRSREELPPLR